MRHELSACILIPTLAVCIILKIPNFSLIFVCVLFLVIQLYENMLCMTIYNKVLFKCTLYFINSKFWSNYIKIYNHKLCTELFSQVFYTGAVLEGFLRFAETTQDLSLDDGYAPFQLATRFHEAYTVC